jgi:hypothetical protein
MIVSIIEWGSWVIIRPALSKAMYKSLYSMSIMESGSVGRPAVSPSPRLGDHHLALGYQVCSSTTLKYLFILLYMEHVFFTLSLQMSLGITSSRSFLSAVHLMLVKGV